MAISKEDKSFYVDVVIKVAVSIAGVYALNKTVQYIGNAITGGGVDPPDPVEVDETNIPPKWNANSLAILLHNNLAGMNLFVYPELVEKVDELNNDQIKLLYNTYTNKYNSSLTSLIRGEWSWDTFGVETIYGKVVKRMENLGLY